MAKVLTKIIVSNTVSKIENLNDKISALISSKLTFKATNYWFYESFKNGSWDGNIRFFNRINDSFATGLLPKVVETLEENNINYSIIDIRKNKIQPSMLDKSFSFKTDKKLREYQEESVKNVLINKVGNISFIRGIINAATNAGKTVISEAIIHQILPLLKDEQKILFLTHSKEIAYQAKENIEKDLGITVGIIGDGLWDEKTVTVALIPTLHRNHKKKQFKQLSNSVVAFVADETHRASGESWIAVIKKLDGAFIRIGLTGTIPDDDVKKHQLFSLVGTPITKISNDFLINSGFSATPICYFIEINNVNLNKLDYTDAYELGVVDNEYRNKAIVNIVKKEVKAGKNILVLVERINHGEILLNMLKKSGIKKVDFMYGSKYNSSRQDDRKAVLKSFKDSEIQVLIASSILEEGIDVEKINVIIYAKGMKSSRKLLQSIGRGLRKKDDGSMLVFYDFLDYTCEYLCKHTLQRYEIMEKEKFKIQKLDPSEIIH